MSWEKITRVKCDGAGCSAYSEHKVRKISDARERARDRGWEGEPGDMKCPRCKND